MESLEELYRRYRGDLFRYLVSLTHDPHLAEDLLSETFIKALQSLESFRGESSVKTWLMGIARNLWLQQLRGKQTCVEYTELLGLYLAEDAADRLICAEQFAGIELLLQEKDERTRRVFRMRVEGLPYAEIAAHCSISEGSARVLDFRTKKWLKERLKKEELL